MVLAYQGGLSSQQQKKVRAQKARDVQTLYESEHKRVMRELAAAIKRAKGNEREELTKLREACAAEREVVSQEAQKEFEETLALMRKRRTEYLAAIRSNYTQTIARLTEERAALLREAREKAKQRKDLAGLWPEVWRGEQISAKAEFEQFVADARRKRAETIKAARGECLARGTTALSQAVEKLKGLEGDRASRSADKNFSRAYEKSGKANKPKVSAAKRAKERKEESDDEVRSNIPPELTPIFEKLKGQVKANERKSRTEAFLEMYEEDKGNLDAWLAAKHENLDEKRMNAEMERWYEEQRAQSAYVEAQQKAEAEERKTKAAKEAKKARKAVQTEFASKSGRGIAEKKSKQKQLLDDMPDNVSDAYLPPGFEAAVDSFSFEDLDSNGAYEAFGTPL